MQVVYVLSCCAVAERGSSCNCRCASAQVGTSFSIPAVTKCTPGSDVASRALPSLVTSITLPVSAISAFAPVSPAPAPRK